MNEVIQSFAFSALEYVPDSVKDATGLQKQILDDVAHIKDVRLERIAFLSAETPCNSNSSSSSSSRRKEDFLTLTYNDGFQIWKVLMADNNGKEIVSYSIPNMGFVRLLPLNPDCVLSRARYDDDHNVDAREDDVGTATGADDAAADSATEPAFADAEAGPASTADEAAETSLLRSPLKEPSVKSASRDAPLSPLVAYVQQNESKKIHIFSLLQNDTVYVLRLVQPVLSLQATKRFLAAGFGNAVELYDARDFSNLLQVQTAGVLAPHAGELGHFALGDRWLAYYDQSGGGGGSSAGSCGEPAAAGGGSASAAGTSGEGAASGSGRSAAAASSAAAQPGSSTILTKLSDGISFLGQISQKTLDSYLDPMISGVDDGPSSASSGPLGAHAGFNIGGPGGGGHQVGVLPRGGAASGGGMLSAFSRTRAVIAVRDCVSRQMIGQFATEHEVEHMKWDSSGTLLISCTAMAHHVLVHRVVVEKGGRGGALEPRFSFQHAYTLSRGITPARISDVSVSPDSRVIAVSTRKGTTHLYLLPHSTMPHVVEDRSVPSGFPGFAPEGRVSADRQEGLQEGPTQSFHRSASTGVAVAHTAETAKISEELREDDRPKSAAPIDPHAPFPEGSSACSRNTQALQEQRGRAGSDIIGTSAAPTPGNLQAAAATRGARSSLQIGGSSSSTASTKNSYPISLNAVARIKLGSSWLQEALRPVALFQQESKHSVRSLCIATRAGTFAIYSLRLLSAPPALGDGAEIGPSSLTGSKAKSGVGTAGAPSRASGGDAAADHGVGASSPAVAPPALTQEKQKPSIISSSAGAVLGTVGSRIRAGLGLEGDSGTSFDQGPGGGNRGTTFVQQLKSLRAYRPKGGFVPKQYEAPENWDESDDDEDDGDTARGADGVQRLRDLDPPQPVKHHVPIWFSPQLSFYSYSEPCNDKIRIGEPPVLGRRALLSGTIGGEGGSMSGSPLKAGQKNENAVGVDAGEQNSSDEEEYWMVPEEKD